MATNQRAMTAATGDMNRRLRVEKNHKRRAVFFIMAVCAVFGWTYLVFMSNTFSINDVEIAGAKELDPMDIKREVFDLLDARTEKRPWPARHAWFIDQERIKNDLKTRLFVNSVTVDNSYTNVLRLSIEERSKRLIFHSHKQYFWVDLHGIATDELSDAERKDTQARLVGNRPIRSDEPPVIKRDLDELINVGYTVTNETQAKEWIQLADQVKAAKLVYREIEPPTASSTLLKVLSPEGYTVLMDITTPLEMQVKTYQLFIQNGPKDLTKPEYVDVRVPGRVYLK